MCEGVFVVHIYCDYKVSLAPVENFIWKYNIMNNHIKVLSMNVRGLSSNSKKRLDVFKVALYKDFFPPIFHLKTAVTFLILHQN